LALFQALQVLSLLLLLLLLLLLNLWVASEQLPQHLQGARDFGGLL